MYYVISATILSLFLYWILQTRDDEKAKAQGQPLASTSKRVMLFFFLMIVTTCLCFFVGNAMSSEQKHVDTLDGGGGDEYVKLEPNYKTNMIKSIQEDVIPGLPPFHTMHE